MRNAAMSMLVLVLAWVGAAAGSHPEGVDELAVKVMSFNVRYGTANDGDDHWLKRRELLLETIQAYGPDLLGTQETLAMQRDWLSERLPKFACWAAGRDDGAEKGEMAAMYWNTDRFAKLDGGHFWLSPTPEQVGSKGWDAALPRIVSWVKLQDKKRPDAVPVYFFNTHFDHRGREARLESARLLRRRVGELAGEGRVLGGGGFYHAPGGPPPPPLFV